MNKKIKLISDAWELRKLINLGSLTRGKSKHRPRNDKKLYGGKYPFVQTGDVAKAGLFLDSYRQTYSEFGIQQSKLWNKGTLLITIAANIAETSILNIEAAFPDSIIGFESDQVEMVFIKNIIDNASNTLKRKAETSSQANLSLAKLSELSVLIPSLKEQNQLGSFFKQIDDTIALHQRKLEALKEMKKGFLQQFFPQKGEKVPRVRFANFHDEWELRKLSEHTKLITKGTTPKDKSGIGSINYVKVENIRNGKILPITKITEKEHNSYLKRSRLEANDILFSIAGTLGKTAIVDKKILPANINQALAIVRGFDFDKYFLITSLVGNIVTDYIRKNPTIGAQPNLSLDQIQKLKIWTPNIDEQKKVGAFSKKTDDTISLHQNKIEKLKILKNAYLQNMFI